jgi:hypothetical protein
MIRSAFTAVASRCAITHVVRPRISCSIAPGTSASDAAIPPLANGGGVAFR